MIVGIGMDIVEVERIRAIYLRHPERFVRRILTENERAYVLRHADPTERLAGRWAAKEAALKALGTGLAEGIGWRDVEILPDDLGRPCLHLHGKAAGRAKQLGAGASHVTITHSRDSAVAQVILERADR
ncbi:MAG: holo-ACP synthase [Planctomycetes bacterium]|nr:holo-ACP synthase [Planctomycetota bacterium]